MASAFDPENSVKAPDVSLSPIETVEENKLPSVSVESVSDAAPAKPSKKGRFVNFMDQYWVWEAIGVVGSALCIVGICLFLNHYNKRPIPEWAVPAAGINFHTRSVKFVDIPVSFNSVIGWFSTIGKILVLIPIVKGLGQLKWVWFTEEERDLTDFETFDAATRGLTGSAMLLWKFKTINLAVLGALAMILSLAYDPLIQNLVTYPLTYGNYTYWDDRGGAYIAWTKKFDVVDKHMDPEIGNLDTNSKQMILDAIYDTALEQVTNKQYRTPSFYCYSGNCTWPLIPTLSAWTHCADLTEILEKKCFYDPARDPDPKNPGCDYSLPNGFKLGGEGNLRNRLAVVNTTQSSGLKPIVYDNYTQSNTYFTIVQAISVNASILQKALHIDNNTSVVASECVIVPALITGNSSVGRSPVAETFTWDPTEWQEHIEDVFLEQFRGPNDSVVLRPTRNDTLRTGSGNFTEFTISNRSMTAFRNYLNWILPSYVDSTGGPFQRYVSDKGNNAVPEAIFGGNPWSCTIQGHWFDDTLACNAYYIADAITTSLRNAPYLEWVSESTYNINISAADYVEQDPIARGVAMDGNVFDPTTILLVNFKWIILPVALWTMSTVFILGVMWRTRRSHARTWRTNPLAVVFLDIGDEERTHVHDYKLTEHGLSKKAKNLKVKLQVDEKEARLVRPMSQSALGFRGGL